MECQTSDWGNHKRECKGYCLMKKKMGPIMEVETSDWYYLYPTLMVSRDVMMDSSKTVPLFFILYLSIACSNTLLLHIDTLPSLSLRISFLYR